MKLKGLGLPKWPFRPGGALSADWSWLRPKYPPVAFELDPKTLAMARIGRRKDETFLAAFDIQQVPPDLVELDFLKARLTQPALFREMIARCLSRDPVALKSVSVIIPDSFARVAILPFEELPRRRADTLELIRFKTKKSVPFKVEEASVDYQVLPGEGAGVNVLAVLTPRSVVEELESAFSSAGLHTGLVDLSTFSLVNLYSSILEREMPGDSEYLIANVTGTYFTFVIFRGPTLVFFRCKTFAAGVEDASGEGALRLLKRELQTSLVYWREKLGGQTLAKAYLRVVDLDAAAVQAVFAAVPEIGAASFIDPRLVVTVNGRVSGEQGERVMQALAPAIGSAAGRGAP